MKTSRAPQLLVLPLPTTCCPTPDACCLLLASVCLPYLPGSSYLPLFPCLILPAFYRLPQCTYLLLSDSLTCLSCLPLTAFFNVSAGLLRLRPLPASCYLSFDVCFWRLHEARNREMRKKKEKKNISPVLNPY